jgi:bla regulator protein blaR1
MSKCVTNDQPQPARRRRTLCRELLFAAALAPAAFAQQRTTTTPPTAPAPQSPADPDWQVAATGKMSFEVASIRPSEPGTIPANISMETDDNYRSTGGLFTADRTLETYINFAYKLHPTPEQREAMYGHMPKWVATQNFAIQARAAGDVTLKDQMRLMMQSLLADRFKLAVHFEQRNEPVFALRLIQPGRLGPNIRRHEDGPPCTVPASRTGAAPSPTSATPASGSADFPFLCGQYLLMPEPHQIVLWGSREVSMTRLANWIAVTPPRNLGRPVVDQTGLKGKFDFTLEWQWTSGSGDTDAQADQSGPTVEEALKQQLGLKLQPTHAPVIVLLIDHVEQPSPN